jgi:hypothetical protein
LQLIEDHQKVTGDGTGPPVPFTVEEGEWFEIVVRFSSDSVCMQFQLERLDESQQHAEDPPAPPS